MIILHKNCDVIINTIEKEFDIRGLDYIKIDLDKLYNSSFVNRLKLYSMFHGENILLCNPLNSEMLKILSLLLVVKPLKVGIIIPPDPIHSSKSIPYSFLKYFSRIFLDLLKRNGIKILIVFTTPYERIAFGEILHGFRYIYLPTYSTETTGLKEILYSDRPVISFFTKNVEDLSLINDTVSVLEELGFKPRFIVNFLSSSIDKCLDDYRIICIHSDDTDQLIKYSTLTICKTPSPETNNIILKSIQYTKPVITTMEHGLALYYHDTGLIFLQKKWSSENLADSILEVLNNIDQIKKKSLSLYIDILKSEYGGELLISFFRK